MINFISKYAAITSKLSDLFGYKFMPSRSDNSTLVGTLLIRILTYNNTGDVRSRDFELNRLAFLVQHLENLKEKDKSLLKHYIKILKKQERQDSFWGFRFEVSIASSLINKKVNFQKQESPDFLIDNTLGIECSSIRIRKNSKKRNYNYKISSLLNKKAQKQYNNSSTAVFIDFTNMIYTLMSKKIKVDTEEIRNYTKKCLNDVDFGSILLFSLIHTKEQLEQVYLRIDNEVIDPHLKQFLDKHYSSGHHYIDGYGTSVES